MHAQRIKYYMPTIYRTTCSGRKSRTTSNPLFPGYIFVKGICSKQSLKESGCVLQVIRATTKLEEELLDHQIRDVWSLTNNGTALTIETDFKLGETVKILSGSLTGVSGTIIHIGKARKLTVWVDMLGVGVSVVLSAETDLQRLDSSVASR